MAERSFLSACPHDCPDTCAMLTTVRDGRVMSVRGNPNHPFTRGGLCVKVKNYEERVYSPDRVLRPLRRTGSKGHGEFEPISWDAALTEIRDRFKAIIARRGSQAIMPCSWLGTEGLLNGNHSGDAFFNRLGATIAERTLCAAGVGAAYTMVLGMSPGLDPESFAHARFILLWGCNVISTALHHWPFIADAQRKGATIVVIDPLRSRTAAAADWHIPIRPGTDAALALGIVHVIIKNDLVDHDYVERHTLGFTELAERAKDFLPARVAAITGVSEQDIEKLARAYATTQPAAIRGGVALERCAGGGDAVRAISSLPALIGAWRHVGGGIMMSPGRAFPIARNIIARPDLIPAGTRVVNVLELGRALTGRLNLDPPIEALFVYNSNPLISAPESGLIVEGLAREDLFTVVSEQFLTDTALYADMVLPAATQLEQIDLMFSWGHFYLTWNEQVIQPLGEAVSNTELFRRLASAMGFNDDCFRRTDEEKIQEVLDWGAPAVSGISIADLRKNGFARLNLGSADTRVPHANGEFLTPSGKCEFKSSLAPRGSFVMPNCRQGQMQEQPGTPVADVPDYVPPRESPLGAMETGRHQLALLTPKSHAFLNSSFANMAVQRYAAGEQCAMIHPDDASARGICNDAMVTVFNERGRLTCKAKLTTDIIRGAVAIYSGYWRGDSRDKAAVNVLAGAAMANIGRAPTFSDVAVDVALA